MAPTDEMMPELPEPLERLLRSYGTTKKQEGWFRGAEATDVTGGWEPEAVHWNHAAFEAERALRLAILGYPHDAAAGAIARLTDEGTPPKE